MFCFFSTVCEAVVSYAQNRCEPLCKMNEMLTLKKENGSCLRAQRDRAWILNWELVSDDNKSTE